MPRDELKKRIEALNKRPLTNVPEAGSDDSAEIRGLRRKLQKRAGSGSKIREDRNGITYPVPSCSPPSPDNGEPIVYTRSAPASTRTGITAVQSRDFGPAISLEDAVEGVFTGAPAGPGHYLIERRADSLEARADNVFTRFVTLTGHPDGEAVSRISRACGAKRIAPQEVLFLDLETTGLGMTPVFLVGTMECADDGFAFRQYFARDYSEEMSIVSAISKRLEGMRMLVTFNGKTFDMPFLRNRAVATGVQFGEPESQLDLLHEARRVYRDELPDCRLQTLEARICGRTRDDDIPGSEIPEAYHEYVRTGNANKINVILLHNLYDLLTMADLMNRMWWGE